MKRWITLKTAAGSLYGALSLPSAPSRLILIAHSHPSPIDEALAEHWLSQGFAIFSISLLTEHELQYADAAHNVPRLTQRLIEALDLIRQDGDMQTLKLGIYASGTSVPAAIRAAAQRDAQVGGLVCHGGQIDQAGAQALKLLVAPTLLLASPDDTAALSGWERAAHHLGRQCARQALQPGELPDHAAEQWLTRFLTT